MIQCLINDETTNFAIFFFGLNSSNDLFDELSKPKVEKAYLVSFFFLFFFFTNIPMMTSFPQSACIPLEVLSQ